MPVTPGGGHEFGSGFSQTPTGEAFKTHPFNRGTPLTIKKNKVARIQICEIRYNRTRASINSVISKQ